MLQLVLLRQISCTMRRSNIGGQAWQALKALSHCSNLRAITVDQEASTCKLALVGQTPETTLNSALASISFFVQQQELVQKRQEAQWKRKVSKVEAAAKKKLQEIHNAYNEV